MAFIRNVQIPTPKKYDFRFTRFEGGLNNKTSPLELKPHESPKLLNVMYNEIGSFQTRPGLFKYALNKVGQTIHRMFVYETKTIKRILLSGDSSFYRLDEGADTFYNIKTVNTQVNGTQKEDKFYFVGGNKYYEYDGTTLYTITNPIDSAQIDGQPIYPSNMYSYDVRFASPDEIHLQYVKGWDLPNITSPFVGWYFEIASGKGFKQKGVISDFVRDIGTSVATLSVVNKLNLRFTGDDAYFQIQPDGYYNGCKIIIPAKDARPKQERYIAQYYGQTHEVILDKPLDILPAVGERMQVMKQLYKINTTQNLDITPDSTSTILISRFPIGELTVDEIYKYKIYTPTALEFSDPFKGYNQLSNLDNVVDIMQHKNRLWFLSSAHPNNIFYTDLDNQYYLPTNHFITSITNDGDEIVALKSFNDVLVIFKRNTVFALYGDSKDNFVLKELNVASGVFNSDVIQQVGNYLFYLGNDGNIYALYDVRTDTQKMMSKCISDQIDLMRDPINININKVTTAKSVYIDNMYILTIDDKILVYNELYDSWLLWDNIKPTSMLVYNNQLLLTNSNRYLYRMPFKPFYIEETYTKTTDLSTIIVNKGYINEIGIDFQYYKNNVLIDSSTYSKTNNKTISIPVVTSGTVAKLCYTSMLCYNDQENGSYSVVFHTKDNDFSCPNKRKKFRKIFVTVKTYKWFSSIIQVKGLIDWYDINTDINIKNQIAMFGIASFGDRFIDKNVVVSEPITINQRGKIVRFIIEMTCNDNPIHIYEINGEYEIL
ncbi:MAG: hypothetical protein PHY47_12915 [Lachnospiraceae bacterium]|nr:hypothetical protein [Lachnospiraceae bacterium]